MVTSSANLNAFEGTAPAVAALVSKAVKVSKAKGCKARLCPSDW
jgi:hypothetical protein